MAELTRQCYGKKENYTMEQLKAAWRLRRLDALALAYPKEAETELDHASRAEWRLVDEARDLRPDALEILEHRLKLGHGPHDQLVTVPTDFLPAEVLQFLQERVIDLLNQKHVAIESMPTSNLRIAPYSTYDEHHIFRWLGLEGNLESRPTVILASDDPGIFANNLRNEYAHLLEVMTRKFNLPADAAMGHLQKLMDNTHAFSFGDLDWHSARIFPQNQGDGFLSAR